jgi:hypothetical protein
VLIYQLDQLIGHMVDTRLEEPLRPPLLQPAGNFSLDQVGNGVENLTEGSDPDSARTLHDRSRKINDDVDHIRIDVSHETLVSIDRKLRFMFNPVPGRLSSPPRQAGRGTRKRFYADRARIEELTEEIARAEEQVTRLAITQEEVMRVAEERPL